MPLLDHFHPPVSNRLQWQSFHSAWATHIANDLNANWLSEEFLAAEFAGAGTLEIDVAAFEQQRGEANGAGHGSTTAALMPRLWTPPAATFTVPAIFPESFEVRVFSNVGGLTLVAAIELVSPGNKDRPDVRRAFAAKCASYLHRGVSLIIMDVVTDRRANLHNALADLLEWPPETRLPADPSLYAVAYRPVLREGRAETDLWPATVAVGEPLPTLPLRLTGDIFVPVEFEATYQEACRRRRLA
jgi:hypothetical protein